MDIQGLASKDVVQVLQASGRVVHLTLLRRKTPAPLPQRPSETGDAAGPWGMGCQGVPCMCQGWAEVVLAGTPRICLCSPAASPKCCGPLGGWEARAPLLLFPSCADLFRKGQQGKVKSGFVTQSIFIREMVLVVNLL